MTQSIRDAAQALLDAESAYDAAAEAYVKKPEGWRCGAHLKKSGDSLKLCREALRDALAAPAPTDDERVYEHMVKVGAVAIASHRQDYSAPDTKHAVEAVESSARALLATAQQDAEHAAMYRWLRDGNYDLEGLTSLSGSELDAAIRAAMKEAK